MVGQIETFMIMAQVIVYVKANSRQLSVGW